MWADRFPRARQWHSGPAGNRFGKAAYHGPGLGGSSARWRSRDLAGRPGARRSRQLLGIDYAPSDWKVDDQKINKSPSPASEQQPHDQKPAPPKPVRSHRWRLTDISAGACYLEASAPFPAGTPVLLSI